MAENTEIQWCDSTSNLAMGCRGCELWNPSRGVRHCYAGVMTEKYAGGKGWSIAFDKPILFPERMEQAEKWRDLTGADRSRKPWLNGYPRLVFLNDMSDTFTRGLPRDWLADYLPRIAASPHIYMSLTKRARQQRDFSWHYNWPDNLWAMTTITTQASLGRGVHLGLSRAKIKILSVEPMLERITLGDTIRGIDGVIVGFESGEGCRPGESDWMRYLRDECQAAGVKFFCKQMGGIRNHHGELSDIPEDLRIRELPVWTVAPKAAEPKIMQAELW